MEVLGPTPSSGRVSEDRRLRFRRRSDCSRAGSEAGSEAVVPCGCEDKMLGSGECGGGCAVGSSAGRGSKRGSVWERAFGPAVVSGDKLLGGRFSSAMTGTTPVVVVLEEESSSAFGGLTGPKAFGSSRRRSGLVALALPEAGNDQVLVGGGMNCGRRVRQWLYGAGRQASRCSMPLAEPQRM